MCSSQNQWTKEFILDVFNREDCLSELTYCDFDNIKYNSTLEFKCGECGYDSKMIAMTFCNGKGFKCIECRIASRNFSRPTNTRYTTDIVRDIYESYDCVFLDHEYSGNNNRYNFKCSCGNVSIKQFSKFVKNPYCKDCSKEISKKKRSRSDSDVRKILENMGLEMIGNYNGSRDKIDYICECGLPCSAYLYQLTRKNGSVCKKCADASRRGENAYNWNGGYDNELIAFRKTYEFKKWRKDVFARDQYSCQVCSHKGKGLNAHHIDGYNWCKEKRTDVDNGITLCEDCHNDFHNTYGRGNNTSEQFNEWMEIKELLVV